MNVMPHVPDSRGHELRTVDEAGQWVRLHRQPRYTSQTTCYTESPTRIEWHPTCIISTTHTEIRRRVCMHGPTKAIPWPAGAGGAAATATSAIIAARQQKEKPGSNMDSLKELEPAGGHEDEDD